MNVSVWVRVTFRVRVRVRVTFGVAFRVKLSCLVLVLSFALSCRVMFLSPSDQSMLMCLMYSPLPLFFFCLVLWYAGFMFRASVIVESSGGWGDEHGTRQRQDVHGLCLYIYLSFCFSL